MKLKKKNELLVWGQPLQSFPNTVLLLKYWWLKQLKRISCTCLWDTWTLVAPLGWARSSPFDQRVNVAMKWTIIEQLRHYDIQDGHRCIITSVFHSKLHKCIYSLNCTNVSTLNKIGCAHLWILYLRIETFINVLLPLYIFVLSLLNIAYSVVLCLLEKNAQMPTWRA